MDYVCGRKNVGGMINSIGFSEQDCVSIKYMFEYFEKGLAEISYESLNDFCIVLESGQRLYFQVKINQFNFKEVRKLLSENVIREKTVFIGSSFDDDFRNLNQSKERYLQAKEGILCEDKDSLFKEMEELCRKNKIDSNLFLNCDFYEFGSMYREDIAKGAIEKWARKRNIFIDIDALFNELITIISNRLRTIGGYLTKNEIQQIISRHKTSKIESFISKGERVSSIIEKETKIDMARFIDNLIVKYDFFKEKLILIKYYLENEQLVEAKNNIERIIISCQELEAIYLMVLNILGEYDAVIERKDLSEREGNCIGEFAKAYMYKKEYIESQKCLEKLDKSEWDCIDFYISAINFHELQDDENAKEALKRSISLNNKFVDAYIFLASLIYQSDAKSATNYLDIVLSLDPKHAKAYLLKAQICQLFDDFALVVENCEKYVAYSGDDENELVWLMIATNKFHIDGRGWQIAFQKWNEVFRKNHNIVGETKIMVMDVGRDYLHPFAIDSLENGMTVFWGSQEVFSYRTDNNMARTLIGLYSPQIETNMMQFCLQNEKNPVKNSSQAIFDKVALPTIIKKYDDYKSYQHMLESLLNQKVLHLNHEFGAQIREYVIYKDDISVEMQVVGDKLMGDAIIGEICIILEINPLSNSLDRFVEQLNKDCGFNEAAILLIFDEAHQTQLTFPKEKMKLTILE